MVARLWVVILLLLALAFGADLLFPGVTTITNQLPTTLNDDKIVPAEPAPVMAPTATTSQATSTPPAPVKKTKVAATSTPATKKASLPTPVTPPTPPPQPTQSEFDATATTLRGALVNFLCISGRRDIPSISGSGVIIDPRGIVLTNAHIAQYFIYTGDPSLAVSCAIRTGSPARDTYRGALMYLPSGWVTANAKILSIQNPTGNGEYDFAFIAINKSATSAPLPTSFPFIPLSTDDVYVNEPAVVGAYPAQFLSTSEIQSTLYPTVVFGSVKAIFTFIKTTIDVLTLGGSAAAQEGSSGGGIARAPGVITGIVTTSTTEGTTADRTLGGITTSYIYRAYQTETGSPLSELFALSPTDAVNTFLPQISGLREILLSAITN